MEVLKTLDVAYITYDKVREVYQLYDKVDKDEYTSIADIHFTGSWIPINDYVEVTSYDNTFNVIKINKCSVSPSVITNSVMIVGRIQLLKGTLYE